METLSQKQQGSQLSRQLANLKIVSRLLAHELHAQATTKTVTLSRDEVVELQTCVDLYIEEATRRMHPSAASTTAASTNEPTLVSARNN